MKNANHKKRHNTALIFGIIILSVLLLYWLFAATIIDEDEGFIGNKIEYAP